jgi:hypothetical protein
MKLGEARYARRAGFLAGLGSHRQTDPSAFEMPVFAPRPIYNAAAVQGWYLFHWLEATPLTDCGAIFAKVLDRLRRAPPPAGETTSATEHCGCPGRRGWDTARRQAIT